MSEAIMSKRGIISSAVSGVLYLVCSGGVARGVPLYDVTLIPHPYPPGQFNTASASGLNDLGQVVGTYLVRDEMANLIKTGAFIYSDGTGTRDLPFPSGMHTPWVEGINNSGQVTLYGRFSLNAPDQSYRYTPGIGYQPLGTFGGNTESRAINNLGQVTGFSENAKGRQIVYRYTDGAGLENLTGGIGRAINDRGWVAGSVGPNAALFRDGETINLGPGRAHGINNGGDVVGETYIVPGHDTAFVYLDGQMTILGDADFGSPVLNDVNGSREAVGYGFLPFTGDGTALYWSESTGGLVDLNTLIPENSGWTLGMATAINEHGQILGWGGYNGEFAIFRLNPIPEPSTWALMVLGGVGLFWFGHRRKR